MSRITLEQAARWCGGTVAPQYAQVEFPGAANDSPAGSAGAAVRGAGGRGTAMPIFPTPLSAGAAAVLCSRCDGDYPAVVTPDPRKALGDIA